MRRHSLSLRGHLSHTLLAAGILAAIALLAPAPARSEVLTFREGLGGYAGTEDTWFSSPTSPPDAPGFPTSSSLATGLFDSGAANQQVLLQFTGIFGAGGIPQGATIHSATLAGVICDPLDPGDPDGDGLDGAAEQTAGTDPCDADSDDDGLTDGEEVSRVSTLGFGPQQVISALADYASSVFAADLDGDGDPDALSASYFDDEIAWYENRLDEASADFGPQQTISTLADAAQSVFAADLDRDGDPDVLSASSEDDKIAWYENRLDEASADFGPQRVISAFANGALSVFAADFDGDGDPDVLGVSSGDEPIAWYENPGTNPLDPDSDGDGLSDGAEVNTHGSDPNDTDSDADGLDDGAEVDTYGTDPADADSDGDGLDDGAEVNTHGTDPADDDSDGDGLHDGFEVENGFDPLVGGEQTQDPDGDGLDNLGEQTAGSDPHDADSDGDGLSDGAEVNIHGTDPTAADSDGDGLLDGFEVANGFNPLVAGEQTLDPDGDDLGNLGEQGAGTDPHDADSDDDGLEDGEEVSRVSTLGFGPQQVISTLADRAKSVFAADLDGDGDPDVLSASRWDDEIAWYENRLDEASADFGPQQVISTLADSSVSVFAVDLDGDGDPDVLSGSYADDKIAWYENPGTNPLDPDSDGDGLTDGFEVDNGFDPLVAGEQTLDPDSDGLDNLGEQTAGTDPHDPDSDGDGATDGREIAVGTDPLDPQDVPPIPALPKPAMILLVAILLAAAWFVLRRRAP
jgi:hypothetical protein